MYVCLCNGVSDRAVRKAIRRGATTVDEIGDRCGAGTGCGGCRAELERLLEARRPGVAAAVSPPPHVERVGQLTPG